MHIRASYDVYIGRAGNGEDGYFGNPFRGLERAASIAAFRAGFDKRIWTDVEFADRVLKLRGKRLGCFCKPLACHGDVIAAWVDSCRCEGCEEAYADYAVADPNREGMAYPDPKTVVYLCSECAK